MASAGAAWDEGKVKAKSGEGTTEDVEMELPGLEEEKGAVVLEEVEDQATMKRGLLYDNQRRSMSMLNPSEQENLKDLLHYHEEKTQQ
jgi:hypothetical protein